MRWLRRKKNLVYGADPDAVSVPLRRRAWRKAKRNGTARTVHRMDAPVGSEDGKEPLLIGAFSPIVLVVLFSANASSSTPSSKKSDAASERRSTTTPFRVKRILHRVVSPSSHARRALFYIVLLCLVAFPTTGCKTERG